MRKIAGVDGCPGGWFAACEDLETGEVTARVFASAEDLFEPDWASLAIDIPIGLPESGARKADLEARKFLAPHRGSSVFPAPVRAAVAALDYPSACEVTQAIDGRRVSKQAFMIFDRIDAVDRALRGCEELRERVYEIHPEVSFAFMNGGQPLEAAKRSPEGKARRQALIAAHFGDEAFSRLRSRYPNSVCADDDVADALAALWTCRRLIARKAGSFPSPPDVDACGLTSAIWY